MAISNKDMTEIMREALEKMQADPSYLEYASPYRRISGMSPPAVASFIMAQERTRLQDDMLRAAYLRRMADGFREEKDKDGELRYPRFDELRSLMGSMMETDDRLRGLPDDRRKLEAAYRLAEREAPPRSATATEIRAKYDEYRQMNDVWKAEIYAQQKAQLEMEMQKAQAQAFYYGMGGMRIEATLAADPRTIFSVKKDGTVATLTNVAEPEAEFDPGPGLRALDLEEPAAVAAPQAAGRKLDLE